MVRSSSILLYDEKSGLPLAKILRKENDRWYYEIKIYKFSFSYANQKVKQEVK